MNYWNSCLSHKLLDDALRKSSFTEGWTSSNNMLVSGSDFIAEITMALAGEAYLSFSFLAISVQAKVT